jgi:outer membrane biosynthesis protein TonB
MLKYRFATLATVVLAVSSLVHAQGPAGSAPTAGVAQVPAAPGKEPPTRAARPSEVRVRVLLLTDNKQFKNEEETIEVGGVRYIHFNSPRLKARGRPLEEPKLRYPTGEFSQKNGAVLLQLLINEQGVLEQTDVVCAAPPFERSARESVAGLKFQPALAKEGPVKSYMLVEFGYGKGLPCASIPD